MPANQVIAKSIGMKMSSVRGWPGWLYTTIAAPPTTMARPIRACRASLRLPSRNEAIIAAMNALTVVTTSCPSMKEIAAASSQVAAGAANGKR